MTHGSLFSGIGGFDLAAEWMGWTNLFHCERDKFGQQVLAHYWPESKLYDDVTTFDATIYRGRVDVLTGGFPCQPYSTAGLRKGKDDDRHLWPHMLRVIAEARPRWVVGENVRGLLNWNDGLVFAEVQTDLEDIGYTVLPFLLPAVACGAVHRRDRIWFVAHTDRRDDGGGPGSDAGARREKWLREWDKVWQSALATDIPPTVAHADSVRSYLREVGGAMAQGKGKTRGRTTGHTHAESEIQSAAHPMRERVWDGRAEGDPLGGQVRADQDQTGDGWDGDADRPRAESTPPHPGREGLQGTGGEGEGSALTDQGPTAPNPNDGRGLDEVEKISAGGDSPLNGGGGDGRSLYGDRRSVPLLPPDWNQFPTVAPLCGGDDGIPRGMDGITFPKWRAQSVKAYGNAVVPPLVYKIFRAIQRVENYGG